MTLKQSVQDAVQKALYVVDATRAAARKTVSGTLRVLTVADAEKIAVAMNVTPDEARAKIAQAHAAIDDTQRALKNHKNGNGKG